MTHLKGSIVFDGYLLRTATFCLLFVQELKRVLLLTLIRNMTNISHSKGQKCWR